MWLLRLILVNSLLIGIAFAKVYEIAEPDMLEEIEAKRIKLVKRVAEEAIKAKDRFYSLSGVSLSPSTKNYTYTVDPTYTLQTGIPIVDKKGNIVGILYPKGYRFNPLDYIRVKPPPMIIFNACDDREVFIVKKLMEEKKRLTYILISAGCSIKQIKERRVYNLLKHRIYLLTSELKDKLKLKHTISFVDVDLKRRVIVIEVYKKDIN